MKKYIPVNFAMAISTENGSTRDNPEQDGTKETEEVWYGMWCLVLCTLYMWYVPGRKTDGQKRPKIRIGVVDERAMRFILG